MLEQFAVQGRGDMALFWQKYLSSIVTSTTSAMASILSTCTTQPQCWQLYARISSSGSRAQHWWQWMGPCGARPLLTVRNLTPDFQNPVRVYMHLVICCHLRREPFTYPVLCETRQKLAPSVRMVVDGLRLWLVYTGVTIYGRCMRCVQPSQLQRLSGA